MEHKLEDSTWLDIIIERMKKRKQVTIVWRTYNLKEKKILITFTFSITMMFTNI